MNGIKSTTINVFTVVQGIKVTSFFTGVRLPGMYLSKQKTLIINREGIINEKT